VPYHINHDARPFALSCSIKDEQSPRRAWLHKQWPGAITPLLPWKYLGGQEDAGSE